MKTICAVMMMAACLVAANKSDQPPTRTFQIKIHNINQIELCISNFGKFGQTANQGPGLWWPKGSGHTYMFGAGSWFGTVDSASGDTLVSIGYGPHGSISEFAPGLSGMDAADTNAIIFMDQGIWPPPAGVFPMAPQTTVSHQDSWCCFNDSNPANHVPGDTRPIGIEVYQTVYVWNLTPIQDIAFLTYQIKNVSDHNLKECYYGICADNDIGNEAGSSANDRVTVIRQRAYYIDGKWYIVDNIGYQWQETPEPGWSEFPGVIGFDLLQTGFDLQPGMDKDNDGISDQYERDSAYYRHYVPISQWDVDNDNIPDWRDASENPQLGMTAFKIFSLVLGPNRDNERYLTLAGYNFKTGQYEPFDTVIPAPDDQRFLMASGPFELAPDSALTIVFAIMLTYWHDQYQTPDTALVLVDHWAQHVYDMGWRMFGIKEDRTGHQGSIPLVITPNPARAHCLASFTLPKAGVVSMKMYNSTGRLVRNICHANKPAGMHLIRIDTEELAAGTYFITLETDNQRSAGSLVILK